MRDVAVSFAAQLVRAIAQHLAERQIDAHDGPIGTVQRQANCCIVEHFSQFFLAIVERLLHALALTDVEDGADQPAQTDRKSTRLNSSHIPLSRMPSSA